MVIPGISMSFENQDQFNKEHTQLLAYRNSKNYAGQTMDSITLNQGCGPL